MTGKVATKFLPRTQSEGGAPPPTLKEWAAIIAFGAVQWPWLLRSLSGGDPAERTRLLARLDLPERALPALGSWKADAALLHNIVDVIERDRSDMVVELGSGATTLVTARALQLHGGGRLVCFDQHGDFVGQTHKWLREYGLEADMRGVDIARGQTAWPGFWYVLRDVPERINLLTIDGPPWTIHPLVRGAADSLFDRIVPGGTVLLDDAARPGERVIAARWARTWPEFSFRLDSSGTKGALIGVRR